MSADVLQMISIIAFVFSGIFTVAAVIIYFRFNIRSVMDGLSGRKAERQIKELREQNQENEKHQKSRIYYKARTEKTTEKLLFKDKDRDKDEEEKATTLSNEEETEVLAGEATMVLKEEGTMLLDNLEETTLLVSEDKGFINGYKVLLDEIVIHTQERI